MEPKNSGGPVVAYIDGQPVDLDRPLPEITPSGVSTEDAAEAMATASKAWADISITMEVAAEGLWEFFRAMELSTAIWVARIFKPDLFHRYLHTKKKRTRKKYEKRILAWFREVFR